MNTIIVHIFIQSLYDFLSHWHLAYIGRSVRIRLSYTVNTYIVLWFVQHLCTRKN